MTLDRRAASMGVVLSATLAAMAVARAAPGPGIPKGRGLGRVDMRDVAPTLAARLGLALEGAEGRDVLK